MKKILPVTAAMLLSAALLTTPAAAANCNVSCGSTIWKLAIQYLVGNNEIISANPQIPNLDIIYPDQTQDAPQVEEGIQDFESEVIRLVNEIRAQYGLSALSTNLELCQVARYKSEDMVDKKYFAHESPTYGSPFQMMQSFGISYRTAGENIAYGQRTPEAVVNAWMNSSGHRANILNASYTQTGVGFCSNGYYWTQMFIG